jgi:diguanylate cyclase (GGDEF)-like protein
MRDIEKSKQQLIAELAQTRRRCERIKGLYRDARRQDPSPGPKAVVHGGSPPRRQGVGHRGGNPPLRQDIDDQGAAEWQSFTREFPGLYFRLDNEGMVLDLLGRHTSELFLPRSAANRKMGDTQKSKRQLIAELTQARQQYERIRAMYQDVRRQDQSLGPKAVVHGGNPPRRQGVVHRGGNPPLRKDMENQRTLELQAIFRALPDLYFQLDNRGTILNLLAGCDSDLYFPRESLIGKRIQDVHARVGKQFERAIQRVLDTGSLAVIEYSIRRQSEEQFYEARLAPLGEDQIIAIVRNITERKQAEERLKFLSLHDPLTGLYNRAYFEQEMRRIEGSRAYPAGIIVCDLDGLKLVNDVLGHNAGDLMLVEAANIIRAAFRKGEMAARIGGDEFAVILPVGSSDVLDSACNRIRNAVNDYNAGEPPLPLSISIGYAICADSSIGMEDAFKEADISMYREKLCRSKLASNAIVETLLRTLKSRGFIAEGQMVRMERMAMGLADAIGLDRQKRADLIQLVRFHDIGEIGVPGHILHKQGPLTAEETAEMRRHCEVGHRIAQAAPELAPIAEWILKHHEWYDGRGYPLGLKGDEIPLECRILAIVDAYDAMTDERPYSKAMTPAAALAELERCAGTQFDPLLVEVFLKLCQAAPEKKSAPGQL